MGSPPGYVMVVEGETGKVVGSFPGYVMVVEEETGEVGVIPVTGKGSKVALDGSKCRVDLVPPQTIEAIGTVLGFGAKKYAAHNWMKGIPFSAIYGGILRHLLAFMRGEEMDPESGLPHLHHALCGLTLLSYYAHGPNNAEYRKPSMDDRVFRCPGSSGGQCA